MIHNNMVCSMTRSKVKVKVTSSKLEIRTFQKLSPPPFTMEANTDS